MLYEATSSIISTHCKAHQLECWVLEVSTPPPLFLVYKILVTSETLATLLSVLPLPLVTFIAFFTSGAEIMFGKSSHVGVGFKKVVV